MVEPIEYEPYDPSKRPQFLGKIWDEVKGFFTVMFGAVWANFAPVADSILFKTANTITKGLGEATDWAWGPFLDWFIGQGLMTKAEANEIMKWKKLTPPWDTYMLFKTIGPLYEVYIGLTLSGSTAEMKRAILSKYTPERPGPETLVAASFIAPEKTQEARNKMKEQGFDDADIDLFFLSRYRLYDEGNVRILWLRGVLSDDQMFMRMRELGYTDTRIKEIIQGWSVIPGPNDLFHLVAKEAFEPDMVERMGYADEFPGEQVQWLQKQGISEEWAKKYWYAHWETPSIQMGFEMFHREDPDRPGQSIIDESELDMLYRTVEIPPYWRSRITKIAYQPYTRVDVRRMHDMGVLTDAQLIQSYKDLGYDQEHAEKMGEFTVKYNQGAAKELTRGQIVGGYKDKILTRADALTLITDLGYTEAQAEYFILTEDYNEAKDLQDEMLTNIKDRFQNNLADEFTTRSQLNSLNLTGDRIAVLMDKWKIKKMIDVKVPSKTDLDKFLLNKIITLDIYRQEMDRLGYNFKYIGWYEKLSGIKGG